MTEDDTFKALKKLPFSTVMTLIDEIVNINFFSDKTNARNEVIQDIKDCVTESGWSIEEFTDQYYQQFYATPWWVKFDIT